MWCIKVFRCVKNKQCKYWANDSKSKPWAESNHHHHHQIFCVFFCTLFWKKRNKCVFSLWVTFNCVGFVGASRTGREKRTSRQRQHGKKPTQSKPKIKYTNQSKSEREPATTTKQANIINNDLYDNIRSRFPALRLQYMIIIAVDLNILTISTKRISSVRRADPFVGVSGR